MHQVGVSFDLYYDARKHKIKKDHLRVPTALSPRKDLFITRLGEPNSRFGDSGGQTNLLTFLGIESLFLDLPAPSLVNILSYSGCLRRKKSERNCKSVNPLTSNDHYTGRTASLTSNRCMLYIYSTNIGTEYFKYGIYFLFFSSSKCSLFHNSNVFGSCIIHILYTGVLKFKKKSNSGTKRLSKSRYFGANLQTVRAIIR